jgi:DNA-binding Lrp family transcriptional regulator
MEDQTPYPIDKVDRQILSMLLQDSRRSYQDIARELIVSGGTIHVRTNKMKEAGVIKGSRIVVDFRRLGLEVTAFVGVNLGSAKDYQTLLPKLKKNSRDYRSSLYDRSIFTFCKSCHEKHKRPSSVFDRETSGHKRNSIN